jgi:hypothetical protein
MAFVSVTRLRIRTWQFLPGFALAALRSRNEARRAPGYRNGSLLPDRQLTFWTLTLWTSEAAMRAFMTAGAHRAAMPKLRRWCDEASVVHWDQTDETLPGWEEANRRMRADGRPSSIAHPSPAHAAMTYREPRLSGAARL